MLSPSGGLTVETVICKLLGVGVVHTIPTVVRDGRAPLAREAKK